MLVKKSLISNSFPRSQEEDEVFQTEYGDELSFLVENFQLKEQKNQNFMPYIY